MDGESGGWDPSAAMIFFKIFRTVTKMLDDRGYEVENDESRSELTVFVMTYTSGNPEELNHIYVHPETNDRVKVKYNAPDSKILSKDIQALLAELQNDHIKHCIYIVNDGMLSKIYKSHLDKRPSGIRFEIFERKELMINITEHELVPRHRALSPEEKRELLDRYKVRDAQLPRILREDPVVRYLGVEPGTVLEVTRKSETAGRYVTYRLVC
jgi:DNA-directed RNA polymerase I, II, and III subunit RPABC1